MTVNGNAHCKHTQILEQWSSEKMYIRGAPRSWYGNCTKTAPGEYANAEIAERFTPSYLWGSWE